MGPIYWTDLQIVSAVSGTGCGREELGGENWRIIPSKCYNINGINHLWNAAQLVPVCHRQNLEADPGGRNLWSGIAACRGKTQLWASLLEAIQAPFSWVLIGNKTPASWDYYSLGLCLMCEVLEQKRGQPFPSLLWLRDSRECNLVAKCTSFISSL